MSTNPKDPRKVLVIIEALFFVIVLASMAAGIFDWINTLLAACFTVHALLTSAIVSSLLRDLLKQEMRFNDLALKFVEYLQTLENSNDKFTEHLE